jgi:hypothetical protein
MLFYPLKGAAYAEKYYIWLLPARENECITGDGLRSSCGDDMTVTFSGH